MARINIEDSLWKELAWFKLLLKIGDYEKALGALFRVWIVAQKYWVPERKLIPKGVWESEELNHNLIGTFVREEAQGYYVRGSKDQFAWLMSKHDNGKKGGRPRKPNETENNLTEPKITENNLNAENAKKDDLGFDQKPSSSYSYSYSKKNNISRANARGELDKFIEEIYSSYPKRLGDNRKKAGLERLRKILSKSKDLSSLASQILKASKNYQSHCKSNDLEKTQFVKQFASWVSVWEEWENLTPQAEVKKVKVASPNCPECKGTGWVRASRGPKKVFECECLHLVEKAG